MEGTREVKNQGITKIGCFTYPLRRRFIYEAFLTVTERASISTSIAADALADFSTDIAPSFI
jgi:hypothetical protein